MTGCARGHTHRLGSLSIINLIPQLSLNLNSWETLLSKSPKNKSNSVVLLLEKRSYHILTNRPFLLLKTDNCSQMAEKSSSSDRTDIKQNLRSGGDYREMFEKKKKKKKHDWVMSRGRIWFLQCERTLSFCTCIPQISLPVAMLSTA